MELDCEIYSTKKGYIAINSAFDKLITSLRTAVAEENTLDKESTSYPDILDAYRLALKDYKFITKEVENEIKTVTAKPKLNRNAQHTYPSWPVLYFPWLLP